MIRKPRLSVIEKWILWHLGYPGEYQDDFERRLGFRYSVTPEKLIYVLPKPMLKEINDVNDARQILEGLREKGLVSCSSYNSYSISTQGVLILRRDIEDEIAELFIEPEKTRQVLKTLEKNQNIQPAAIRELKDLGERVKHKAKDEVADIIVKALTKAGGLALWHILLSGIF